eukprot:scaffold12000_cov96-Isochrysis_galbana.AAC.1
MHSAVAAQIKPDTTPNPKLDPASKCRAVDASRPSPPRAGFDALLEPWLLKRLMAVVVLQALQQFSGINAVVYYTPQVNPEIDWIGNAYPTHHRRGLKERGGWNS